MKKAVIAITTLLMCTSTALACVADIGTANTSVYVRNAITGQIEGSLAKNDRVIVTGKSGGWCLVEIGGNTYKVYGDYLDIERNVDIEEVTVREKTRKSKSAGKSTRNTTEHKIKGSNFDNVRFW